MLEHSLSKAQKKAKVDSLIKHNHDVLSVVYDDSILKYVKDLRERMRMN